MIEAFWIPLLPPYLIGLALSFVVEALLTPRPVAPWRRPVAAVTVHLGVWTLAFALELALFRRPYFGIVNVLAVQLLLVLVNNAKYHALREPFVYPDFEYFLDALRHPRLYLPFFGIGRAFAAGGGYGVALAAGLMLEDSVTAGAGVWLVSFAELPQEHMFDPTAPAALFFAHTFGLALAGLAIAVLAGRGVRITFQTVPELRSLGIIAFLWAYGRSEKQACAFQRDFAPFSRVEPPNVLPATLPNLVAIQSESFFDARRIYPGLVKQDVLANFDVLKAEALEHGQLKVPAWGANTVRTEFAFLSGMNADTLGVHQYNPYRKLAMEGFATIASYLRSLGYRTICVHPYHRTFYQRDKVLPQLGFDEFVGIEDFEGAPRSGPYVGDIALGEKVIQLLRQASSTGPLYVHVITMENHGPLHWESVVSTDALGVLKGALPEGCEDLVAYARHLRNADAMFGALRQELKGAERPASLCVFGDHVPIMPSVYQRLGESDGATDYVIWRSDSPCRSVPKNKDVESLAEAFLKGAGLVP
ncbi:LTA synthase family protein [Achromobacter marplatensis]|uniref:LTA synthase family protein n=1 Tax=Achromobacter marplatensis TaxID=470868 RepID=A0AA42WAF9_9BURK|nr:LTA synthase family protein [Achromobacter marplatensis]MDH2050034.1 LTA synthase family protein [Achromobacter marplatensis]